MLELDSNEHVHLVKSLTGAQHQPSFTVRALLALYALVLGKKGLSQLQLERILAQFVLFFSTTFHFALTAVYIGIFVGLVMGTVLVLVSHVAVASDPIVTPIQEPVVESEPELKVERVPAVYPKVKQERIVYPSDDELDEHWFLQELQNPSPRMEKQKLLDLIPESNEVVDNENGGDASDESIQAYPTPSTTGESTTNVVSEDGQSGVEGDVEGVDTTDANTSEDDQSGDATDEASVTNMTRVSGDDFIKNHQIDEPVIDLLNELES